MFCSVYIEKQLGNKWHQIYAVKLAIQQHEEETNLTIDSSIPSETRDAVEECCAVISLGAEEEDSALGQLTSV
jgi:hypothetical protein